MDEKTRRALELMATQGGNFARSLAHTYFFADPENRWKLEGAFANLFDRYRDEIERIDKVETERETT